MSTAGVIVLEPSATEDEVAAVLASVSEVQPSSRVARGDGWTAIPFGGIGSDDLGRLTQLPGVSRVVPVTAPYRIASKEAFGKDLLVRLGAPESGVSVGGLSPVTLVVGSRWAMGSEARLKVLAPLLVEAGCSVFHAGRLTGTERDPVPGTDIEALRRVRSVADEHGFAVSVEVADAAQISAAQPLVDVFQVGSHNMQDFGLLRDMGRTGLPVILKRGPGSTVEEFILAAEYILSHGNGRVILCESGIRTFDSSHRPRFEINAVPLIKGCTHLPLLADPSASTAHARLLPAVARAAVAAGADGLFVEVGTDGAQDPDGAVVDVVTLRRLMAELRPVARAVGRSLSGGDASANTGLPSDARDVLHITDRTLGLVVESIVGVPPQLEVVSQWRLSPPLETWLSGSLTSGADVLARSTSYRLGEVRLSRNLAYVDLGSIDPTIAVLLESKQLNLGQLFLDPRIEKRAFRYGSHEEAGPIDAVFQNCFPDEVDELHPYVWRRYQGVIGGKVVFVVIEALPTRTWDGLLKRNAGLVMQEGRA